jgi:DNA-binding IclR family transcriptional regulator
LIENAPIHCTSVGKAILAFQRTDIIDKIVAAGLERYTDATLVAAEPLLSDLEKTRAQGYALDDGEHRPGLRCVGAPIYDQFGNVSASVSVSAPAWQIPLDDVEQLSKIVVYHANNIAALIGYVPEARLTRPKAKP